MPSARSKKTSAVVVPSSQVLLISRLTSLVSEHGSQRALAEALGVSEAYISSVMHGRFDPSKSLLSRLNLKRTKTTIITYEDAHD